MEALTNNTSQNFTEPQRQSPAAIIIMMLKSAITIFKTFWPALLVILFRSGKEGESPKVLLFILAFGALTIVFTLIRYFFYYFHVENDNLVIKTGWLKKKTLSIPLKSIQAVHLEQNIWQQFFQVAKVTFDSAGSEKVEAKIDALQLKKAEQLKQLLLSYSEHPEEDSIEKEAEVAPVYKLEPADLLKLSLSANHLEAFFILLALSLNLLDDLKNAFEIDGWNWMERMGGSVENNIPLAVSILILFAAFISIAFSTIRTLIKYFNFKLQAAQHKWKISFGLLNRQERIIPHKKIQVYSWHANWLRRKLDFWLLDIKTVGQDKTHEKQKVKIPLTSMHAATELALAYQQSAVSVPLNGLMIEPAYWQRRTILVALPVTIFIVAIAYIFLQWQSLWIGLLFFYFAYRNYQWYKNYRWFANDEGLQLYSGLWGRRYTLLRWNKVQKVSLSQTPYQRNHQLASVKFVTAGGPISLPYIPIATANELVNNVLYLVESKNEQWM